MNASQGNRDGRGIPYMLLAMALFTTNDALGKWLVVSYPVGQLIAIRSAAALCLLLPLVWRRGDIWRLLHLERPALQLLRIALVVSECACFYWAVRYLPLADVFMFYQAAPLFLTALSVPLLGEWVGPARWFAVIVGFIGVVLIFPPSEAAISPPALIALAGSLSLALMLTLTRILRGTGGLTLLTYQTLGVAVAGSATLPVAWATPDALGLVLLALIGLVATAAHFLMNRAVALSPSAVVAPFQYTSIVWALALGYVFWGDFPRTQALAGAALIVAAGLFVLRRSGSGRRRCVGSDR
jgi:drug/metabolite transporter (DMT)-like permease